MLTAAKVRPLEEFFQPERRLRPSKEVAISINRGSILCLCATPPRALPKILRVFHVHDLKLLEGAQPYVRWTISDDSGCWFDGSSQQVDLYKGLLLVNADMPLRFRHTNYGPRVVFKFLLPHAYRVHHLGYLQKFFPESLKRYSST